MARPKLQDRSGVRSERMSVILTAPTYEGLVALSQVRGCSMNDLINLIADNIVERNSSVINRYKEAINSARADINLNAGISLAEKTEDITTEKVVVEDT